MGILFAIVILRHFVYPGIYLFRAIESQHAYLKGNVIVSNTVSRKLRERQATSWYWQLDGPVQTDINADVYDIDGLDASEQVIRVLHSKGRYVICYTSVGTLEDWRADSRDFPKDIIGSPLADWSGEYWLDIRRTDILLPLMERRIRYLAQKGCDAIEPDNIDVFVHDSGFSVTAQDALEYLRELSSIAHSYGLEIGLKNSPQLVSKAVEFVDFAVVEECIENGECDYYKVFLEQQKPVFAVEYTRDHYTVCKTFRSLGFIGGTACKDLNGCFSPCFKGREP